MWRTYSLSEEEELSSAFVFACLRRVVLTASSACLYFLFVEFLLLF